MDIFHELEQFSLSSLEQFSSSNDNKYSRLCLKLHWHCYNTLAVFTIPSLILQMLLIFAWQAWLANFFQFFEGKVDLRSFATCAALE